MQQNNENQQTKSLNKPNLAIAASSSSLPPIEKIKNPQDSPDKLSDNSSSDDEWLGSPEHLTLLA